MITPMTVNHAVLDAAAVKAAQDGPGQESATVTMSIKVTIYQHLGNVYIGWAIDPPYAIGPDDTVQLQADGVYVKNFPVNGPVGSVDTGHGWGTGWTASYWSMDFPSNQWHQLVITPSS